MTPSSLDALTALLAAALQAQCGPRPPHWMVDGTPDSRAEAWAYHAEAIIGRIPALPSLIEAARREAGLDVERLAEAIGAAEWHPDAEGNVSFGGLTINGAAKAIAAKYARSLLHDSAGAADEDDIEHTMTGGIHHE